MTAVLSLLTRFQVRWLVFWFGEYHGQPLLKGKVKVLPDQPHPQRVIYDTYAQRIMVEVEGQTLDVFCAVREQDLELRFDPVFDPIKEGEEIPVQYQIGKATGKIRIAEVDWRSFSRNRHSDSEDSSTLIVDCDAQPLDLSEMGWEVVEHNRGGKFEWDPSRIKLQPPKSQATKGDKPWDAPEGYRGANANVLDFLLANRRRIPEEWKRVKRIYFPETVYRLPDGQLAIRFLHFRRRWYWVDETLDHNFEYDEPAAMIIDVAA